jgi:tetratricopeptide (TPR) repeat protein
MKKYLFIAIAAFLTLNVFAQQGQKLTFKTTVKDKNGAIVANSNVIVKISILEGSASGKAVFSEMHVVRTDAQGQVALEVGKGSMTSGSTKDINWDVDNFIQIETQPMGTTKTSKLRRSPAGTGAQNKSTSNSFNPASVNTDSLKKASETAKKQAALFKADSLYKASIIKKQKNLAIADSIKKANEIKKQAELTKLDSIKKKTLTKTPTPTKTDTTKKVAVTSTPKPAIKAPNTDSIKKANEAKKQLALAKADSLKRVNEVKKNKELAKADSVKKTMEAKRLSALAKADSLKKVTEIIRLATLAKADSAKKAEAIKKQTQLAKADSIKKHALTKTPPPYIKIDAPKPISTTPKSAVKTPNTDSIKKINDAKRAAALARADSIKKAIETNKQLALKKAAINSKPETNDTDFKVVLKVDTTKALELKKQIEGLKQDSAAHTTTISEKQKKKKTSLQPTTVATEVSVKQTVDFETIIKNINGAPFTDAPVMVKTSVLKDSAKGNAVFIEEHAAITDSRGIVKLNIGGGTPVSGAFKTIDWANGKYFIKTEANPTGVTKIDRINSPNTIFPQSDSIAKMPSSIATKRVPSTRENTASDTTVIASKTDSAFINKAIALEDNNTLPSTNIEDGQELNEPKIAIENNKAKWDEYRIKLYLQNEAIEKKPNDADAYLQRGLIKQELEDYRGALSDFNKALSLDSSKTETYNVRGLTKISLNNHKSAIDDFNKSIKMDAKQSNTFALRGIAYAYMKNFKDALLSLDTAILLARDSAKYYAYRGTCKYNMNDLRGALDDYNTSIKLNQNNYLTYYNRANTKTQMRDQIDAIDDYNKAITLAPTYAKAYYKRGNAKAELKDVRGAIMDYEKTINIDPENARAYYNAGVMKTKLKEFEAAINYFDKTIEFAPDWGSAYYNRGISKISLDRINEGCIDLSIAGEKGYPKAYDIIKRRCSK